MQVTKRGGEENILGKSLGTGGATKDKGSRTDQDFQLIEWIFWGGKGERCRKRGEGRGGEKTPEEQLAK